MPRPCKRRRVCALPRCNRFIPRDAQCSPLPVLHMTVDEYECLRLIDHEALTQEECARRMNVARTTVQAIYAAARVKLARFLFTESELVIDGGDYVLCEPAQEGACCAACPRVAGNQNQQHRRNRLMKIAVTYENGQIFQHFGHTEQFKIYEVKDGKMVGTVVPTQGSGHGALAGFLAAQGVDTLICGGIGMGAQVALDNADIKLYAGITGSADEAVAKLLAGVLPQNASANCNHHDHDHACGEHGCGHDHHDGHACHCHD